MITREFNLYLHAGHSIPLVINANQYDRGEQWLFKLFNSDGTQYVPSSGAIVGIKSDNLGIINSGTVDSQGRVVINETQQMTAAVGKAVFELVIDDGTHGTANFVVLVEPKPGDNADLSESDLSLIQQAIDGTSATAIAQGVSDWMDDNLTPTTPVVDTSLTVSGAAADSAKVGQEISDLKSQIAQSAGLTSEIKQALMDLANNVAWSGADPTGQTYINALQSALYPPANLSSISAVYSGGTVYDTATLNDLKSDLIVTAHYDNGTSEVVNSYTLSGNLTTGTNTITVNYGNKTATFDVVVVETPFSGNRYVAVANETPLEGYINDNGEQTELANSYYIDKLYDAVPFAFGTDGAFSGFTSSLRARMAYYDGSESFLSRDYLGSGGPIVSVTNANAVYQKVGWTSLSPNYAFLLEKDIDESSFVNADVTLDGNGGLASKSGASTTDFIAIETGADKFILLPHTNTTQLRIAFYDVNQTFISRFINFRSSTTNPTYYNDIPANAKYYRLTKESSDVVYQPVLKVI